jgi:hypothetical protein
MPPSKSSCQTAPVCADRLDAPVQQTPRERIEEDLAKATELRDPPVLVYARLTLDGRERASHLYGWAYNPNGGNDGLRGPVLLVREYVPGFYAEFLGWIRAGDIRRREE